MIVVPIREFIEAVPNIFDEKGTIGKMAADYLLDLGFRHFAYCGFENICWSQDRCEGFCRALQKAGYQVVVYPEPPGSAALSWEKESAFMIQWLRSLPKPVGVMACNDERGQLVIDACSHAGLLVPEQVAVIGVDNDDLICELAEIPLSSIAMNFEKVGYEIASLLDQMMSGKSIEEHQFILRPTHVVARQSTDVVAIEDQDVAEAVRFIRNHAQEPIHVVDVMNVVPLARRTLEMKFRKILGRTIYEEITRVRMDHVSRMLTETDLSISQIAQSMEYTNLSPIWRSFRKEKGMTPMEYRGLHSVK
jgi:LacI family transcriptional regulator